MQHQSYFVDFLNDHVNLDEKRLESLDTSINAIQNCIAESDYGTKIRFFRSQGSLAHRTIIRPKNGSEFDADILMVVQENDEWDPKKYLYDLKRVLNCSIPEHCIDARRLPLFIARSVLRDLIAGLRADAEGVQTA